MSTYRKRLSQPSARELFSDYDDPDAEIEWTIELLRKLEFAACVQVIEKLGPVVLELADDQLETCFDILVTKTMPTRFALESESEGQRNKNIRSASKRWEESRNAVKLKPAIDLARKMNKAGATRDEIFAALRENARTSKLVKGLVDKELARKLLPFNVLPRARRKR